MNKTTFKRIILKGISNIFYIFLYCIFLLSCGDEFEYDEFKQQELNFFLLIKEPTNFKIEYYISKYNPDKTIKTIRRVEYRENDWIYIFDESKTSFIIFNKNNYNMYKYESVIANETYQFRYFENISEYIRSSTIYLEREAISFRHNYKPPLEGYSEIIVDKKYNIVLYKIYYHNKDTIPALKVTQFKVGGIKIPNDLKMEDTIYE